MPENRPILKEPPIRTLQFVVGIGYLAVVWLARR
jgi:hypothetical protein